MIEVLGLLGATLASILRSRQRLLLAASPDSRKRCILMIILYDKNGGRNDP
jgi:hypothetical protein